MPRVAFAFILLATAAGVWLDAAPADAALTAVAVLATGVVGIVIAERRRGHPIGWILLGHAGLLALVFVATGYARYDLEDARGNLPGSRWAAVIANNFALYFAGLIALAFTFPDGRVIPTAAWRRRARIAAGLVVATFVVACFGPFDPPLDDVPSPLPGSAALEWLGWLLLLGLVWSLVMGAWSLRTRLRTARGAERQQLLWTVYAGLGFPLLLLAWAVDFLVLGNDELGPVTLVAFFATMIGLPVAVGIAILRHQLLDIEVVISRTLVYGTLTLIVAGGYVGLVAGLDSVLDARGLAGLIAAGCVAVAVQPLRERLQRRVDRLVYGYRSEPYAALRMLGDRLHAALAPGDVLDTIVETVREALAVPHVAIVFDPADEDAPAGLRIERVALRYRGEPVGELVLGVPPGREIVPADRRLLEDLAAQAGVAVHAVRLTADLQHSRERLVSAREEERRRVRRDLHDGLGPTLAAAVLGIDAARQAVRADPQQADAMLEALRGQMQDAIADVRRLVYELRPPALDELGLAGAVREQAARLSRPDLRVDVATGGPLERLPAAVEVAAFRIAMEAINNVQRHADATRCDVRIELDGMLEVEVSDDGRGLSTEPGSGVGLQSMRERAQELGGTFEIGERAGGGTVVSARLPAVSR